MQEELDKLYKELEEQLKDIKIERNNNTLNNKSNKPYWDIERKYKEKAKKIREKYRAK